MTGTMSNVTEDAHRRAPRAVAHLFRILAAHRPLEAPSRHVLAGVDEVEVGRGDVAGWRRDGARLRLDVADGWASERHARLTRAVGRWQIEDLGSKNGTLVDGVRVTSAVLADGDVLEIGRSFFGFAAELEWSPGEPPDAGPDAALPGAQTLVPSLARELAQLAAVATAMVPVMLLGPTGAGKEVAARAVHGASGRAGGFVAVNCGAIPRELVESTLFGHRRGAFSGAVDDQIGAFRAADRGTLFLDEIGDLPALAQAALLRALQEREVTPIGATRPIAVDLRVIAATHRDLGALRSDLVYRLRGFTLALPPLAARRADLGLLTAVLLRRHAGARVDQASLHPRAARALLAHAWPGNVRELEHALAAALAVCGDEAIGVDHLPAEIAAAVPAPRVPDDDDGAQRDQLVGLLGEHAGNVRAVARALGKDPVQIRRWLRRFGLDADDYRG